VRIAGAALLIGAFGVAAAAAQDVVTPPVRITEVRPVYTREAVQARLFGIVVLSCDVLLDGTTDKIRIVKSLDAIYGLDQQAVAALRQWRFKPAMRNGVPFIATVTVSLNFTLRERDGTVLSAPQPPPLPAPISAWPASFANDIADPGATWKPDSVQLADTTLHFESPAGWMVRNYPQGSLLLSIASPDGRRMVMTGAPMKTPAAMRLPLPPGAIDGFAKAMATLPALQKAEVQAGGQVQIGSKWWLWLEITQSAGILNQLPPEVRQAFNGQNFTQMKMWSFVTDSDGELVQILIYDWLPDPGPDRDAELRDATSIFRVMLSKMSFSKSQHQ
jgi:TonB family protein